MNIPRVDAGLCQGHGRCYNLAPAVFAPADSTGRAEVLLAAQLASPDVRRDVQRAVDSCPEMAISWEDDITT